jgi:diketogulonate reductase-like aldo/keto reductase
MDHVEIKGARIPVIGFGTLNIGETCAEAVRTAIEAGYTHIDTAWKYGNEVEVGEGIAASGVPRDELFVTTKVTHERIGDGELQRSAEESLANLRLDRVDLFLIHWPNPEVPLSECIPALIELRERGLTRHVGVANFTSAMLDEAQSIAGGTLVCNQIEYQPFCQQPTVRDAIRRHGMALTGYCPLQRGRLRDHPVFAALAESRGKTASQVALRWAIQQENVIPLPKATSKAHIRENIDIFDFALTSDEMATISALDGTSGGRVVNPPHAPVWDD